MLLTSRHVSRWHLRLADVNEPARPGLIPRERVEARDARLEKILTDLEAPVPVVAGAPEGGEHLPVVDRRIQRRGVEGADAVANLVDRPHLRGGIAVRVNIDPEGGAGDLIHHAHERLLAAEADPKPDASLEPEDYPHFLRLGSYLLEDALRLIPGAGRGAKVDEDDARAQVGSQPGVLNNKLGAAIPPVKRRMELRVSPGPVGREGGDLQADSRRVGLDARPRGGIELLCPDASPLTIAAHLTIGDRAELNPLVAHAREPGEGLGERELRGTGAKGTFAYGQLHHRPPGEVCHRGL